MNIQVPVIGICRHRLYTDGEGVSTLVAFHGCPLRCRYCLNSQVLEHEEDSQYYDCTSLYDQVKMDELYFLATGGGITFGGGEPCLRRQMAAHGRDIIECSATAHQTPASDSRPLYRGYQGYESGHLSPLYGKREWSGNP